MAQVMKFVRLFYSSEYGITGGLLDHACEGVAR